MKSDSNKFDLKRNQFKQIKQVKVMGDDKKKLLDRIAFLEVPFRHLFRFISGLFWPFLLHLWRPFLLHSWPFKAPFSLHFWTLLEWIAFLDV